MRRNLTERIAGMSPAHRELLERTLAQHSPEARPIEKQAGGSGRAPASAAQRSQWFVHHLDPGNLAFNKTDVVQIDGELDVVALREAMRALVERHEPLRTTYRLEEGHLVQVVGPPPKDVLAIEEWQGPFEGIGRHELLDTIRRSAAVPFDLGVDLMYRAKLYVVSPTEHLLTRTTHHVAFDKWSAAIANRELSELYAAYRTGRAPNLDDLPIRYRDYAVWQRSILSEAAVGAHLDFYTAHLSGAPFVIDLPSDRSRPARVSHDAATLDHPLSAEVAERVRGVARAMGATPFMVLLAVFGLLLARWIREDQLLVGIPLAGRNSAELQRLVGVFINTGVIRIDTRGTPSFGDLVRRIRTATLGIVAHQDLPFDELVREMAPTRPGNQTPLFQIMFDYINTPSDEVRLSGTELHPVDIGDEGAVYDLTLFVHDRSGKLSMKWEYRTDLFDRPTIASLAGAFSVLLHESLNAPERPAVELSLIAPEARNRLEVLGSGPRRPVGSHSVVDLVLPIAEERPEAVAVHWQGGQMSYRNLERRIHQIASRLSREGLTVGSRVGVMTGRHPEFAAALLGVMAGGAAAVLLDPDQPDIRLERMVETAEVEALVVAGAPRDDFGVELVIDIEQIELDQAESTELPVLDPGDPAYVVFTSGSTGTPKGVVISHGSLVNFVVDCVDRYEIERTDRVLQFASIGFDTVLEETLPCLAAGASIVVAPHDRYPTFEAFARHVETSQVSVLDLPTAWWHAWVDEMSAYGGTLPETVRLVIVGGEAASVAHWEAWRRLAPPDVRWVNTYGPAEASIVIAAFEPPSEWQPSTSDVIPIGYPIANTDLSIVDAAGVPLPPRMVGELVVSGVPVGLGYLGSPDVDRFTTADGVVSYRTGDLARMLPNGIIEFVGRIDAQVKIRGSRVEPGEVEAVLRTHPSVYEAAVVARNGGGAIELAAHLVTDGTDVDDIIRHATLRLPSSLVPSSWTLHDRLPTTLAGKVDRRRLASLVPEPLAPVVADSPMSEVEERVAAVFESVLDTAATVGPHDNFFDLGGHSLLGVRLISRLSDAFGAELPLRSLFDAGTVRSMAKLLEGAAAAS